ncbi:hypothetical protein B0H66DRAFT_613887 [Apodospora peruviana]|uniref:Uncharacterized protein n=1 Tax=Apodospora peruviana TaxID=516989 RepID=A0AAE0IV00_9PEZI|nr:hypothetical protein B0H66DRAFT_613887 [Apodospora peruviana]
MKSQRPLNTNRSKTEPLPKNISDQQLTLVERHRLDIRMGSQATKSHTARRPRQRIPDDRLPAVPGVAGIAVAITLLVVASHHRPAYWSDQGGKRDTGAAATTESSHPDTRAFSQCHVGRSNSDTGALQRNSAGSRNARANRGASAGGGENGGRRRLQHLSRHRPL